MSKKKNLRDIRQDAGLSQLEMAEALGLKERSSLSFVESKGPGYHRYPLFYWAYSGVINDRKRKSARKS